MSKQKTNEIPKNKKNELFELILDNKEEKKVYKLPEAYEFYYHQYIEFKDIQPEKFEKMFKYFLVKDNIEIENVIQKNIYKFIRELPVLEEEVKYSK
jgi:hypothetical protein